MKSFALERLDSEIFEEKSKHTKFGKTEYIEYGNILLDNFRLRVLQSHGKNAFCFKVL